MYTAKPLNTTRFSREDDVPPHSGGAPLTIDGVATETASTSENILRSEFLATMSHEIRTPMNAILGLAAVLKRSQPLTDKQMQCVDALSVSAQSLMELLNDFLDYSKAEAGAIELEEVSFNVSSLVQAVASIMGVKAREKRLAFVIDDHSNPQQTYLGDPTRMKQVLLNLCSNAIKFTHDGSVTLRVHVQSGNGCDAITFAVEDTGIGVAPEKQALIFQKFTQADASISRRYGGTGLGLAISKMLIEKMGSTIALTSRLGEGSRFVFTLDLVRAQTPAVPTEVTVDKRSAAKVLLVEDYPANVMVASLLLDHLGYQYDVVNSGEQALSAMHETTYAAVLMDVQMSGISGIEATARARATEKQTGRSAVPIIGMTAHAQPGDRERCLASGMDDYISKPISAEILATKLALYTGRTDTPPADT